MELLTTKSTNNLLVLSINGSFDADGSRRAQPHIDEVIALEGFTDIELDFRNVCFLDSSGVGALVYLYKRLIERKRNMRIENVQGQPLEIINLLRIGQAIPINSQTQ